MATAKTGLSHSNENEVLELLAIISWRLRLSPRPEDEKKMRLAIIAINSVAESNAHNIPLRAMVALLPDFLKKTIDNHDFIKNALEGDLLLNRLKSCRAILDKIEDQRTQKAYADFIYRFAFKLAGLSGRGFTGMGSNVGAEDAETLLLIRSELGC